MPLGILMLEKSVRSAIPRTISGITTGIYKSPSIAALPLNLNLYIPTEASVPMIVASIMLVIAIIIVFPNDCKSVWLSNSLTYQSNEKPFQLRYGLDLVALNELATMYIMGANKNKYINEQKIILNIFFNFLLVLFFICYTPRLSISPPSF